MPLLLKKSLGARTRGGSAVVLAEVGIECSANDQPPHFTGPRSDLIQFGISKEAAHGEVIDVAISTCEEKQQVEEKGQN